MQIIKQPWSGIDERLGDYIIRLLKQQNPKYKVFRACVAFVRASGVLRLAPSLKTFIAEGGQVEIVAGIDEGVTTKEGLELALKFSTKSFVFHNPASTFHPKLYLFEVPGQQALAFIGSSNLTTGGLFTNYEASIGLELNLAEERDREAYEIILSIFEDASSITTGNAKKLTTALIKELVDSSMIMTEAKSVARKAKSKPSGQDSIGSSGIFTSTPVLPPPPIDQNLKNLIPKYRRTGKKQVDREVSETLKEFTPNRMFIMTLGPRDTRQKAGYSRDIFIPIGARDLNNEFWGWENQFKIKTGTKGTFKERRINILVHPVTGIAGIVHNVRLYDYAEKKEFRLNCSSLVRGAKAGDILVIEETAEPHNYDYEATVIPKESPDFNAFDEMCVKRAGVSPKRYGYK